MIGPCFLCQNTPISTSIMTLCSLKLKKKSFRPVADAGKGRGGRRGRIKGVVISKGYNF